MKQDVTAFIKKHNLLFEDATVMLGVSGGPDSMALLQYFYSIRDSWNLNIIVLFVDHQLRGEEGRRERDYVQEQCELRDIQFVGTSLDVQAYKNENHVGTQLAAREVRYQFFAEQMVEHEADFLALGHHGDDQIETMLMSLARSGDSSSFSGIPVQRPFSRGFIIRPFLCVTKKDIEDYCVTHAIVPKIDPSNKETTYTRNYYRKYVVPKLKEKNENLHMTIQHLSESLGEDEFFLRQEAKKMVELVVTFHENEKKVTFYEGEFKSYSTALQRRAYHLILNYLYDDLPKNLSYLHEENFFNILGGNGTIEIDFPHELKVQKSYQKITLFFREKASQDTSFHYEIGIPGKISLPNASTLKVTYIENREKESEEELMIPVEHVVLPLHIRTRKPGDRMSWRGLNGSKKIKDIFIDEKIPLAARNSWPLVVDDAGKILWLIGLKKGHFPLSKSSSKMIKLMYLTNE